MAWVNAFNREERRGARRIRRIILSAYPNLQGGRLVCEPIALTKVITGTETVITDAGLTDERGKITATPPGKISIDTVIIDTAHLTV